MGKKLIIVESPAKATTIKKYLGNDFTVKASVGHVKDLPKSKLGVDVDKDFEPVYLTIKGKKKVLTELSSSAKKADKVYLAPDPDREGEAIAWHIATEIGGDDDKIYRVLFNEITKKGVTQALANPIKINTDRVNAQQARRILDRLVGYKISPLLWKKVRRGLSAGRVQSVALRLICEREAEIEVFEKEEYWSLTSKLSSEQPPPFIAKLSKVDGKKADIKNGDEANAIIVSVKGAPFLVESVQLKERKKNPVPPFITSNLQQEASSKFRFSAKKTMMIAQKLYEGLEIGDEGPSGLITYMRTDSFRIAADALDEARAYIQEKYGAEYLPEKPNFYKSKKSAQEGHEAIRPTSLENTPERVSKFLSKEEFLLYELVWNRFIASQMVPAVVDLTVVDVSAGKTIFRANGSIVRFKGFTTVYGEAKESKEGDEEGRDGILPPVEKGQTLKLEELVPKQHFTQPPPRYSEAALIKELEDKGIGRPSTYASIMSTILNREYIELIERRLTPTKLGILISGLLVKSFPDILNVEFTAKMEEELDQIEEGEKGWVESLKNFYEPFSKDLEKAEVEMENIKAAVEETSEICEKCGSGMVIKWGRFGRFLACSNYPDCKNTKQIKEENGEMTIEEEETTDEKCDKCGADMMIKRGRFGKFLACTKYPDCKSTKPISLGIKCPEKGCKGEVSEKRTKRGRVFYGCSSYPDCTFAEWSRPVNEKCPDCASLYLVEKTGKATGKMYHCPSKECVYKREAEA